MINWFIDQYGILKAWIVRNGKLVLVTLILITGGATALVNLPSDKVPYIEVNGEIIAFPYTDDNSGEDIDIYTDREFYGVFNEDEFITSYVLIGNNSGKGQNMSIYPMLGGYAKDVQIARLYQDVPYNEEIDVYAEQCSDVVNTTTTVSEIICEDVLTGTSTRIAYRDEWRDISLLVFDDEFEIGVSLSKGNLERKPIPSKYRADIKSVAYIGTNKIVYFKVQFRGVPVGITDEFFIEVVGNEGAYGHLDPTITSDWAGYDTMNTSSTLVAVNDTDVVLLDDCSNDSATLKSEDQADGDDIRYTTSTAIGSEILSHETVSYASGDCEIYIKVPTISSTTPSTIYKWAGNSGAASASTSTTWSDFETVWHFENDVLDATTSGMDLTNNSVTFEAGQIGGSALFNAAADNLQHADADTLDLTGDFSINMWVYFDSLTGSDAIYNKWLTVGAGYSFMRWGDDKFGFAKRPSEVWCFSDTFGTVSTGNWYYVHAEHKDGVDVAISVNGGAMDRCASPDGVGVGSSQLCLGADGCTTGNPLIGNLDEIRTRLSIQTRGQTQTDYNNQVNPGTFWDNSGWTSIGVVRRIIMVE